MTIIVAGHWLGLTRTNNVMMCNVLVLDDMAPFLLLAEAFVVPFLLILLKIVANAFIECTI